MAIFNAFQRLGGAWTKGVLLMFKFGYVCQKLILYTRLLFNSLQDILYTYKIESQIQVVLD